jgi:hypothetical protein
MSKNNIINSGDAYRPEPGEKSLAKLIKEAGSAARMRRKKAIELHGRKLRAAVNGTLDSCSQAIEK